MSSNSMELSLIHVVLETALSQVSVCTSLVLDVRLTEEESCMTAFGDTVDWEILC